MVLYLQFTFTTLLVTVALLVPIVIYIVRTNRPATFKDPIIPVDNPMHFDDLAPVDEAEQSEDYMKSLRWALGNKKTQNIALTGPYGSGKSSLLATFKKTYPKDFDYLSISLASFSDLEDDESENILPPAKQVDTDTDELLKSKEQQVRHKNEAQQLIELSILQQIFYKVNQAEIPDSRFKRISLVRPGDLNFFIEGVILFLAGVVAIFFPDQLKKLSILNDFTVDHPDATFILVSAMMTPGLLWIIVTLFRFFRSSGLKKLNISSGEIEIDPKSEASILNKYLDELVYFFSATKFNVVLIEDMDRFNDPEIFTKLRELNTLLNNSSQIKRRIVFVYAIKDNLFTDERTRTKFFDFIIPVIPIINWSNSLEKFKGKLSAGGFKIEPRFVTGITLYINDMRVLKNIFNELLLYNKTLQINKDRQTKLLAMIVYKNMYPNDFADLHEEKGILYNVLHTAKSQRIEMAKDFDKQIAVKEKAINDIRDLVPSNVRQLRSAYIMAIVDSLTDFSYFTIQNNRKSFAQLQEDENFRALLSGDQVRYYNVGSSPRNVRINLSEIEDAVAPGSTYEERERSVLNKSASAISQLQEEIRQLNRKKNQTAGCPLSDVIRSRMAEFPELDKSKVENRLLTYLLSEGYIDSSYPYLISYFYPGAIGRSDLDFLTAVNDRIVLPFEYAIEKPAGLIGMLADYDFEKEAILNIALLNELLAKRSKLTKQGDIVISQLNGSSERGLSFITAYIDSGAHQPLFIKLLTKQWPEFFSHFKEKGDDDVTQKYLKLILLHADIDIFPRLNRSRDLTDYINTYFEEVAAFLPEIDAKKMKTILKELDISFNKLTANAQTQALFDLAYSNNHYVINKPNIQAIIENKNTATLSTNLKTANYSTIVASDCEDLYNYIDQDISVYVKQVLLKIEGELTDTPKDVTHLLNDDEIDLTDRQAIIEKEAAIIEDITEIDDNLLYPTIFLYHKISPTWNNVITYFDDEIDEALLSFLNEETNSATLGSKKLTLNSKFEKVINDKLELAILRENRFSLTSFKSLIKTFNGSYADLDTTPLSNDKISELIKIGLIDLTNSNYDRLRAKQAPLHILLLIKHFDQYMEELEDFKVDNADRLLLLKAGALDQKQQLRLINVITPEMIRESEPLSSRIIMILLASGVYDLEEDKLEALIATASGEYGKVVLFSHNLPLINSSKARQLLNSIGGEYKRLTSSKRPYFPLDDIHVRIGHYLTEKGIISPPKEFPDKGKIRMIGRSEL